MTQDENNRRAEEYRRKALEKFPLKLIETTGEEALAKWQALKSAGQGSPVVLRGEDGLNSFNNLLDPFGPDARPLRPVEDIVKAAASISFPDDLAEHRRVRSKESLEWFKAHLAANPNMPLPGITQVNKDGVRTLSREETIAAMEHTPREPPLGDWSAAADPSPGLSVVMNFGHSPPPKIYVGIAPTEDWTTIPAWLRWGNWNDCPAPEYHVAAMRRWRDRYGAELVGMSSDTLNFRVATRPKTREEALTLAREHYVYCADVIDQGVQTYSALAANLMANDWWYFWWD